MRPVTYSQARIILIWTVITAHVLMAGGLLVSKVSLDPKAAAYYYLWIGVPIAFQIYAYWRKLTPLYAAFDTLVAGFLITIPVIVWTYVAISFDMPLADGNLVALDTALGFDWRSFISYVDQRPWLSIAFAIAYSSFFLQLVLLPVYFAMRGKPVRACAIVFCYTLLCLISCIVSIWYPSVAPYAYNEVGVDGLFSINAEYGYIFLEHFHAVRNQPQYVLDFEGVAGIITFPSVHAGVAGLCAWAAWDSRLLRWPFLALNIAMAASAISHGSHYLVDVVAGLGIAGLTVSIATALFYPASPSRSMLVEQDRHLAVR